MLSEAIATVNEAKAKTTHVLKMLLRTITCQRLKRKPRHGTKKACFIGKLYYNVYGVDCIPPHASEGDAYQDILFF